jgi:hypothetical protein
VIGVKRAAAADVHGTDDQLDAVARAHRRLDSTRARLARYSCA